MGVEAKYIAYIGLKKSYYFIKCYENSNCFKYKDAIENGYIDNYLYTFFKDYLPPNFICISDEMSCENSYTGLLLSESEYLDEISDLSFTPESLQEKVDFVHKELNAIGIECNKKDIGLHIFVHFS